MCIIFERAIFFSLYLNFNIKNTWTNEYFELKWGIWHAGSKVDFDNLNI